MPRKGEFVAQFDWDLIQSRVEFEANTGCWLWTGALTNGYAQTYIGKKRHQVSRLVLKHVHGINIDRGLLACHKCNTPACVNPHHIYAGSDLDNARDAVRAGRWEGRKTNPPRARISPDVARSIFVSKEPDAVLAARHGLALTTIEHIKGGRCWRAVTLDLGEPRQRANTGRPKGAGAGKPKRRDVRAERLRRNKALTA